MSLSTELFVLLCLSFWNYSLAGDLSNATISKMVSDPLVTEQSAFLVKEWALDWQPDTEEVRSSLMTVGPSIDGKKLFEDILFDDGHDEESEDGDMWTTRNSMGRCGCCDSMRAFTQSPFLTRRQPLFNSLVQTVCDRLIVDIKKSRLDPMALLLRRRSVKETAFLYQSRLQFKRSMSVETDREERMHDYVGLTMDETPTVRCMASLEGLSTLRRTGDVQTTILPNGRSMLIVKMSAGPLRLKISSKDTAHSIDSQSPAVSSERDAPQTKSSQTIVIDELPAEMILSLNSRQGLLLHSFQFTKPADLKFDFDESSDSDVTRVPFRGSGVPLVDFGNEAAIAQQIRRCIRRTLRSY